MTEEEFDALLKAGNYTPEFRKFLENATIAFEELKHSHLKGKIKVKWTGDMTLQSYCDEFVVGSEEGFKRGGIAFKVNMEGATEEDLKCFEEWYEKWNTPNNFKFTDTPLEKEKITFRFPDYAKE